MSKDETNPPEKEAGFLNRWSARKRQETSATQSVTTEAASEPENLLNTGFDSEPASAAPLSTVDEQQVDENSIDSVDEQELALLNDEDMPALETLTAKSDLSDFFNKGVSAAVRRAAFRHVFSLPVYNIRDGLNDYDDDYTYFEPLGDTITSDMKWHKARKEREAAEAEEAKLLAEREAEEEARALEDNEAEQESLENEESQEAIDNDADSHADSDDKDSVDVDPDSGIAHGEDDSSDDRKEEDARNGIHASIEKAEPETTA